MRRTRERVLALRSQITANETHSQIGEIGRMNDRYLDGERR